MKENLTYLKEENEKLKTDISFLQEIIDNAPAFIYINQVDKIGDTSTMRNVWGNKFYHADINYTREEIDKLGFSYFEKILHPDEAKLVTASIDFLHHLSDDDVFGGIGRSKPKNAKDYTWHNSSSKILKRKSDGTPYQFIGIGFPLKENVQTDKQFMELIKENMQLKNQLLLNTISKREKEIIKLLANGMNTEEISKKFNLSEHTTNTHRKNILKKLNLHNTAALVSFAVENGLS